MNTSMSQQALPGRESRALRVLETLFLALSGLFLAYAMKGLTMFNPVISDAFVQQLMLAMELLVLALLILRRHEHRGIWLGLVLVWAYVNNYHAVNNNRLLFKAILVMGFEGIDYRKILRLFIATVGSVLIATVIAGLTGSIQNLVYVREGLRSCWGTAYPTDFSTLVLFLTMTVWIAWPDLPDWAMLILGLVPLALAFFITASRNSLMCGVLFELVVCYRMLERGALGRLDRRGRLRRTVDVLLTVAAPLCAAAFLTLVWLYAKHPQAMERVDNMMSWRLSLSARSIREYGVKPFGTPIKMNAGVGKTVFPKGELFYLDSSYIQMLLIYGWVTMLAMLTGWVWTVRKALRGGNRRMALVMAVIAFHSIMEHHFLDPFHNILLFMPLAMLEVSPSRLSEDAVKRNCAAAGAVAAALLGLGALLLPGIMSTLRTVFAAKGWQGGGLNAYPVLCLNIALVALVAFAAWAVYRLLADAFARRRAGRTALCVLALCLALGIGLGLWCHRVIDRAARDNAAMVEADSAALDCLSGYDVHVDVMPEVYRRQYGNVKRTALGGDDLARLSGSVLLMENRPEHRLFLDRGFSYVQISDAHALYVGDPGAVETLKAAGYDVANYYSSAIELDMEALATRNALALGPEGVELEGKKKSLTKGLGYDLFNGNYVVEYSLFLPEQTGVGEAEVCKLRVRNKYLGVITSVAVNRDRFDAEGRATVQLPLTLPGDTIDVQFQVIAVKNQKLCVQGIRYWQTGPHS